jgi:polyferredoxin/tetratricopeptide (TPR) repeat protein
VLGEAGVAGGPKPIKKSRSARWRFIVLALVHVVMIAHLVQWLVHGLTVSPVEPSESMYTLEVGKVNAGFVFFVLAIASTLVFGRFFCGWGCHVIAVQDACTWLMNRIGVRPKPFRSRLMLLGPLLLALYMFVWPTVRRDVLLPLLRWAWREGAPVLGEGLAPGTALGAMMASARPRWPYILGEANAFPGFKNALIVDDYWATFPPWYVAIPFMLVCGFGTVYFLGSKGFCTYGCPYGGFFGPADRVAFGKIVVNDRCEGCGHCTAVCTSNVRVHQEVRDFGMVVDPGCMKCMDCVSVCPNEALSFGFARPSILATPRTQEARAGKVRRPEYDLTWPEEVVFFVVGLALTIAFRQAWNVIPLLLAIALGAIGAFVAWKLWRMARTPNVRLQSLQLRAKGRVTRAGLVFLVGAIAMLGVACYAGYVRAHRWWGDQLDASITTPEAVVFIATYAPAPDDRDTALRAIRALEHAGPADRGGLGWRHTSGTNTRLAWLHAVAGNQKDAEFYLKRAMMQGRPNEAVVIGMRRVMGLRGARVDEYAALLEEVLAARPDASHVRVARAYGLLQGGKREDALAEFRALLASPRDSDDVALRRAAEGLAQAGLLDEATASADRAIAMKPLSAGLRSMRANLALATGNPAEAASWLKEAIERQPRNPQLWRSLARVREALGDTPGSRSADARAGELERRASEQ